MQKQPCIEPCGNKHVSQCWWSRQDTEQSMHNKCHLNTAYSVWKVLVWATQIKAYQGEQGATQFLASHTISCFQWLCVFLMTSTKLHSCSWNSMIRTSCQASLTSATGSSRAVRNSEKYSGMLSYLPAAEWERMTRCLSGLEYSSQQGPLCRVGWGFFCLFAINTSLSELIQNFANSFFQMAEANFEIKLSNWKHFLLQCTVSICCNSQ